MLPDRAPPVPETFRNRYREIAHRGRALCDKYDLPYNTGPLIKQLTVLAQRTVLKLSVPDRLLIATSDNAPETALPSAGSSMPRRPAPGRGLRTALRGLRDR